jgi:hypothetical protein
MKSTLDLSQVKEPKVSLNWGLFGLKMVFAVLWLAAATLAASYLDAPQSQLPPWFLALAVTVAIAPLVLNLWGTFRLKRLDEREQKIAFQSLFLGYGYAIGFGCLTWLFEVIDGLKVGDWHAFSPVSIVVLPSMGFFFGEAMTQYARWIEHRSPAKSSQP